MHLSASCEDTLKIHHNDCVYHRKPYHYRGQKQTLSVKEGSFHNKRSIATMKRDDRKLKDEGFITKRRRRGKIEVSGCRYKTSITHLTWEGLKHLVKRHLLPHSAFKLWKEICGIVAKKGPPELRDEPDLKSPFFGIPPDSNGWPYRGPPLPKGT